MSGTRDLMEAISDIQSDFSAGRDLSRHHIGCLFQCINLLDEQRVFWEKYAKELEKMHLDLIEQFKQTSRNFSLYSLKEKG